MIFDLDGTLIDTEPAAARAIEESFKEWGLKVAGEDTAFITGRTWQSAIDYLFKKYAVPLTQGEASRVMIDRYRRELQTNLVLVPGGAAAVRALAPHFPLGLVSGSSRSEIIFALDQMGIRDQFKVIYGCEDYPMSKPAPDGFAKALGTLGVSGAETLIFEDSESGIASARAVGRTVRT